MPDFRDLIGDEATSEDLARLRRVHDLLVSAGPAPEASRRLAWPAADLPRARSNSPPAFSPRPPDP
jgi:hypothetical protein